MATLAVFSKWPLPKIPFFFKTTKIANFFGKQLKLPLKPGKSYYWIINVPIVFLDLGIMLATWPLCGKLNKFYFCWRPF